MAWSQTPAPQIQALPLRRAAARMRMMVMTLTEEVGTERDTDILMSSQPWSWGDAVYHFYRVVTSRSILLRNRRTTGKKCDVKSSVWGKTRMLLSVKVKIGNHDQMSSYLWILTPRILVQNTWRDMLDLTEVRGCTPVLKVAWLPLWGRGTLCFKCPSVCPCHASFYEWDQIMGSAILCNKDQSDWGKCFCCNEPH